MSEHINTDGSPYRPVLPGLALVFIICPQYVFYKACQFEAGLCIKFIFFDNSMFEIKNYFSLMDTVLA